MFRVTAEESQVILKEMTVNLLVDLLATIGYGKQWEIPSMY